MRYIGRLLLALPLMLSVACGKHAEKRSIGHIITIPDRKRGEINETFENTCNTTNYFNSMWCI